MLVIALLSLAAFLFAVPFVIYPLAMAFFVPKRRGGSEGARLPRSANETPSVALVICALNEQKVIDAKMKNCLALDYPPDKLRIVVISDGSTDDTTQIVTRYEGKGIELIDHKVRRGKVTNLNEVLPSRTEDIVILSDANVMYKPNAVSALVSRFQDRSVGCVSGRVFLIENTPDLDGPTGQYYSIEWMLQERSSQIYSMVGADGAMYALRRELFRVCPNDTLIEDLVIPMQIIRQGLRVVFEPDAIGWEAGVSSLREEYRRKVRIAAGAAQGLLRGNAWPANAPLRFWLVFIAHKLLRWLSPIVGLALLLLCCLSLGQTLSVVLLSGFVLMTGLAVFRLIAGYDHPLFSAPYYFLFGQVALAIGLFRGMLGRQSVLWAKADR